MQEYGVDIKTTELTELTLTNTASEVKFRGHLNEPFEIITGLREDDGLSPFMFNLILDKVLQTFWE